MTFFQKNQSILLIAISITTYALTRLVKWRKSYTHMICYPRDTAGSDQNLLLELDKNMYKQKIIKWFKAWQNKSSELWLEMQRGSLSVNIPKEGIGT